MSQQEAHPYARGAVIADLVGIIAEVSDLQVKQAALVEASAAIQSRLSRMIRDLSCSTAIPPRPAILSEMRERLGAVRERLEATAERAKDMAARTAPASQAASPPALTPAAQDEGQPESARKASDDRSVGVSGIGGPDQSEELRHVAGAGGESAASADTAPAADERKPKRTFQQPLPPKAPELPPARPSAEIHKQPDYQPAGPAADLMVLRREPQTLRAGGGLVQDGGSATDAPPRPAATKDRVLDLYAETLMSFHEIAKQVGISENSSGPYVSTARNAKDPRVIKGDEARTAIRSDRALNLYADGALSMNEIDRTMRTAAGTAAKLIEMARQTGDARVAIGDRHRLPKAAARVEHSAPAQPPAADLDASAVRKGANTIPDDAVIAVFDSVMVHGPAGSWKADRNVARALGAIADGQLYGIDHIARAGGLDAKNIVPSLGVWSAALARIGVDLIHTKGIGVKLNRRAA